MKRSKDIKTADTNKFPETVFLFQAVSPQVPLPLGTDFSREEIRLDEYKAP